MAHMPEIIPIGILLGWAWEFHGKHMEKEQAWTRDVSFTLPHQVNPFFGYAAVMPLSVMSTCGETLRFTCLLGVSMHIFTELLGVDVLMVAIHGAEHWFHMRLANLQIMMAVCSYFQLDAFSWSANWKMNPEALHWIRITTAIFTLCMVIPVFLRKGSTVFNQFWLKLGMQTTTYSHCTNNLLRDLRRLKAFIKSYE